jgi:hypothetical protein
VRKDADLGFTVTKHNHHTVSLQTMGKEKFTLKKPDSPTNTFTVLKDLDCAVFLIRPEKNKIM